METGGKSSSMKVRCSSTSKMVEFLMFLETKTLKDNKSLSTRDMEETTRDGKYSTLIRQRLCQAKASAKNTDSTSTDHSTSSQDFHSRELLKETEATSHSEDGERTNNNKYGSSMDKTR
jgi:hypothetical protein